jgi:formamidopyrimidine-DNA glycosylase
MLEIPEAQTLAKQLTQTYQGKTILTAAANTAPHGFAFYYGDPAAYPSRLEGRKIGMATALGGQVELTAEDSCLLFNDGTNVRYLKPGQPRPVKHQLLLELDDGSALICSVQMYGGIQAYPNGGMEEPFYYQVAKEKPSPLTDRFDVAYFASLTCGIKPSLSVKGFLATEQRIPGLGNGVLQDILFRAQIHPKRKLFSLTDTEWGALYASVKSTLTQMTQLGGRDTEKDLLGKSGGYPTLLSSKTWKIPCPVCGDAIIRQTYLGGNVYFCPTCQPLE